MKPIPIPAIKSWFNEDHINNNGKHHRNKQKVNQKKEAYSKYINNRSDDRTIKIRWDQKPTKRSNTTTQKKALEQIHKINGTRSLRGTTKDMGHAEATKTRTKLNINYQPTHLEIILSKTIQRRTNRGTNWGRTDTATNTNSDRNTNRGCSKTTQK